MGDIIIKKTSPSPTRTYHIRNLGEFEINFDIPSFIYAIPTSPDTAAIGIKVEGNTSVITVSWTLIDEDTTVVEELTEDDAVKTADEQMVFLTGGSNFNAENDGDTYNPDGSGGNGVPDNEDSYKDSFQPHSIDSEYELQLLPPTGTTPFFSRKGIITKIAISKSGQTPVTYNANIIFSIASMTATPSD